MSGWTDGTVLSDAPSSAAPSAMNAPSSSWQETPIATNSLDLTSPNSPPGYAQTAQDSASFEAGGHITQPYVRIDPTTGQWFLRSPTVPPSASAAGAPAQQAPTPRAPSNEPDRKPGLTSSDLITGAGTPDWQSGTVVGDSPALARARHDAVGFVDSTPDWMRAINNGFAFGGAGIINAGGAALETGIHNAFSHALGLPDSGYGMKDAYTAVRDAERGSTQQFSQQHPWENGGLTLLGVGANPATWAGGEFIAGAKGLLPTIGRSAVVNGVLGSAYGAGSAAPGQHLNGAVQGGVLGVATAPVAPVAGAFLSPLVRPAQTLISKNAPVIAAKLPGVLGPAFQRAFGADQAEQLQAARNALENIGVNFDNLPPADQNAISAKIAAGRSGAESAIQQAGDGLPVPVPLTQGQITGQPGQQLEENLALRGARGQDASIYAKGFQAQQQSALRGNVDAIGANLGGGQPIAPGRAGASLSEALNARYDAAKSTVDQAYDAAREAGPTQLPSYDAQALSGQVRQAVSTYDPLNIPRVSRELDRFQDLANGNADPDIGDLYAARARLTNLRSSNDPVEAGAATAAVKAFDQGMDESLSQSLFKGDPQAVQAWKTAIGARREFGQLFQGNDLIQKLTTRQPIGGQMQLAVDPHDASNYIFGRSDLGFVGRRNLYRELGRVKDVLGADSPSWQAIKAEAFARAANSADGNIENGTTMFSGAKFQKAWQSMNSDDPALMSTLFSPEERDTIGRFAGVAARATSPVRGGDNPSNTAVGANALGAAMGAVRRLPFMALKTVPFIDHFGDTLQNAVWTSATKAATTGAGPSLVRPPVAAQFASGAIAPAVTKIEDDVRAAQ